ncbi:MULTISPECIES: hypothetical protein [unclassified Bradyrhizobium]|uniref:hypothetical protein n=1 Tax=unclassified Bradyrhizobium TaxID=2631580 RepID=UPI0028EB2C44|nr:MULTISPECIES: hypothetical protein [unclassified Bradyrhizobium]
MTPIIAPSINQTFTNDPLILDGPYAGGYLVQVTPNGNGKFTWGGTDSCVLVRDGAWVDLRLNQFISGGPITQPNGSIDFRCNTSNTPMSGHIYVHNNAGFDLEGIPTFYGAGNEDNAIFFDGSTYGAAIADGILVDGRFDSAFRMDEGGGRFNWGGTIPYNGSVVSIAAASPSAVLNRIYMVLGNSELLLGACPASSGYASVGPSIIGGNGLLIAHNCTIPGSYAQQQNGKVYADKG